jgi:NAD(P)-dependent dehydrogenase (short-subunit alcohol dehydrogenase family)
LTSLNGRHAIVAGVGGRHGLTAARALAARGAKVAGFDRDPAALKTLPDGIAGKVCDMSDAAIADAVAELEREAAVDIVVTCPPAIDEAADDPADVLRLVVGPARAWTAAAAKAMKPRRAGAIVHVTGLPGLGGWRGHAELGAAFAAIHNLVQNFAVELATSEVRVNALVPGVDAPEVSRIAALAGRTEQDVLARIPLGVPMPESAFADALVYLAHPSSTYVSGLVLSVDGGWSTWGRLHAVAT